MCPNIPTLVTCRSFPFLSKFVTYSMPFSSNFSPSNRPARLNRQLAGLFPSTEALEEQRRISRASKISSLFGQLSISGSPQPFDIGTLTSTINRRSPPRKKPRNRVNLSRPRKIQRYRKASKPDGFESDSGFLPAVPSFGEELGPRADFLDLGVRCQAGDRASFAKK